MPSPPAPTRSIGFLVFSQFQLLDLAGPMAVFQIANVLADKPAYGLRTVSQFGGLVTSTAGVTIGTESAEQFIFDTLLVSGGAGAHATGRNPGHGSMVRLLASRSRRTTSVCTGAFVLAGAGLLNGRRATTHWRYAALLQRDYPDILVDADPIFVKDGPVWSSAGITAGIDLALALVEDDYGAEFSGAISRELVIYHRRHGGQKQFSAMLDLEPSSDRIHRALSYAREHLGDCLSVSRLAEAASLSERQFGRLFRAETGETPARAIERLRAEAARLRLETGHETIETIGASVGFSDPDRMRRAFLRIYGQPPQALRRAAQIRKLTVKSD